MFSNRLFRHSNLQLTCLEQICFGAINFLQNALRLAVGGAGCECARHLPDRPQADGPHVRCVSVVNFSFGPRSGLFVGFFVVSVTFIIININIQLRTNSSLPHADGHGALSAGASSRLLYDYSEPYRSQARVTHDSCTHNDMTVTRSWTTCLRPSLAPPCTCSKSKLVGSCSLFSVM